MSWWISWNGRIDIQANSVILLSCLWMKRRADIMNDNPDILMAAVWEVNNWLRCAKMLLWLNLCHSFIFNAYLPDCENCILLLLLLMKNRDLVIGLDFKSADIRHLRLIRTIWIFFPGCITQKHSNSVCLQKIFIFDLILKLQQGHRKGRSNYRTQIKEVLPSRSLHREKGQRS